MGLRVAVFQPDADGHHMSLYVRNLFRELLARGHSIHLVTTERALQHVAYQPIAAEFAGQYSVSLMPDESREKVMPETLKVFTQYSRWKNFREGFRGIPASFRPDVAFMVNLDQADLPMATIGSPFGGVPFCGILIGRQFHLVPLGLSTGKPSMKDRIFRPVFHRLLRLKPLKRILILDDFLVQYAEKFGGRGANKVHHLLDAGGLSHLPSSTEARTLLQVPQDAFVLLLFGALSHRKGVCEALAAVREVPGVHLLMAGRHNEEVDAVMAEDWVQQLCAEGRVTILARFLTDDEEAAAFSASDVVWLGYRNWLGSSGVILQSAAAGKPVLGTRDGLIGHHIRTYGMGVDVEVEDADAVREGLKRLLIDEELRVSSGRNGAKLAARHTPEAFGRQLADHIEATAAGR